MNDKMELVCFNLISNSGAAKSSYIEAIQLAKAAKIDEAKQKLTEAEGFLVNAHKIHAELIQKEAAGQKVEFSLLFMHAEDQFASTEMAQLLAKELIDLYADKFANK